MKIAVGIIALVLSMMTFLQSCTITGLSGMVEDTATAQAGASGMATGFLMFLGGAFAFGAPRVARVLFVFAFFVSIPAWKDFPDMRVWGIICLILAVLLFFQQKSPERT
jgi:hypothetical protein